MDPHHFRKQDPDPHQSGMLEPDPHPHQSEQSLESYFEALEGLNLGKIEWYDSRIHNIATLVPLIGKP
jgi:hypothetical protein